MTLCTECRQEKPDHQVKLGVCDECFNFGGSPPKQRSQNQTTIRQKNGYENLILTTSIDVPNREIEKVVSIVSAEAAIGMNIFRDIANNWRDFFGGRSASSQNALRETREACLAELRNEASDLGADAVIAIDLKYNQLHTNGTGGILFVAASGTAVRLKPKTAGF